MLFLDWVEGHCFGCDVTIFWKMTIATIIKFDIILMDTRTEKVSVNNLIKQKGTIYRMILHLPFIVYISSR